MSDLHTLETDLDLKQNLNIYATCKQLDTLHLVLNVYDDSLQADLSNYNVRLKALKSDKIPLIQETDYTIIGNIVTMVADEQLTTTSGNTKIELQFINKTTGEKKATFNLNLKVIASVLEVARTISTATYTLLEELEDKLDQASDLNENISEAIEVSASLNTSITTANTTKTALDTSNTNATTTKADLNTANSTASTNITSLTTQNTNASSNITTLTIKNADAVINSTNLTSVNNTAISNISTLTTKNSEAVTNKTNIDSSISTANTTKTALDLSNVTANTTKTALNTSVTNANTSKSALDTSKTNGDASKVALDNAIASANTFVSTHGDIVNLDNRVTTNTNFIATVSTQLTEKVELYIGETLPSVADRKEKTMYLKITDTINTNTSNNLKVSPTMGLKIV